MSADTRTNEELHVMVLDSLDGPGVEGNVALELLCLRLQAAERERDEALARSEGRRPPRPTDEGGPGKEEECWLQAKLKACIRDLRDIEDYYRLERGGSEDSPNMVRADRARQLYEAIGEDFLNGKLTRPTVRERAEAAEAALTQTREKVKSELLSVEKWAAEQNAGNAFAAQVRMWAAAKLGAIAASGIIPSVERYDDRA